MYFMGFSIEEFANYAAWDFTLLYLYLLSSVFAGQQTGLSLVAAIPPGATPGMNFCQSPETIVGSLTTLAPSAKYVLAKTIRLFEVLLPLAV